LRIVHSRPIVLQIEIMENRAAIAIDVGGTKTLCILVDERFKILKAVKFKTSPADGRSKFSKRLAAGVKTLARQAKKKKLELVGVGVAAAGRVDGEARVILNSPNVSWMEGFNIGRVIKRASRLESVLGNDVQLALYGEHQFGVATGCDHVLGVFFGTGVGGAAIINGSLYRGACGLGGQVGATLAHSIVGAESLESHAIIDSVASKAAISGAAIGMGVKQWAPRLFQEVGTDISKVTWGALERARKAGDRRIDDLLRGRLRAVGIALSSIVNFLNPQMLVLGGGLTEELPRLVVSAVESGLRDYLVPEVSRKLTVKAAKYGNKAGALGAAKLAFEELA
jgi:glucokinase